MPNLCQTLYWALRPDYTEAHELDFNTVEFLRVGRKALGSEE